MTVVVTRDVEARYRGFLASCMLEIAPGVYTSPTLSRGVRERVWAVLEGWHRELKQGAIVMTWRDESVPGGQAIRTLGDPPRVLVDVDGMVLVRREI
jgi:CRISPR-associated protein Cas2